MQHVADTVTLSNGVSMPWFGLGVYKTPDGDVVRHAVRTALEAGYRSVDTATLYNNESGVGQGMRDSGLAREDVFLTTKVWNSDQGYESTLRAFEASRARLQTDYVDLYLIHWPVTGKFRDTWRALETLYRNGWVRAIGVSNFQIHHLQSIFEVCEVRPMVNQVELHPWLTQEPLRQFCIDHEIQIEAWSPLIRGRVFELPVLAEIAERHGKTPAQVTLRWDLQNQIVTIPKSVDPSRIQDNADIYDFVLTPAEMRAIDALNIDRRVGPDPDNFNF